VPHLHVPDLRRPRMPDRTRLRMPDLWRRRTRNASFSAAMRRSLWGRVVAAPQRRVWTRSQRSSTTSPCQDSFLLRVPRSFSAAIGRGLGHSGRRVVRAWASHRPDARLVQTWWASHAADAVIGTVAIASAVVVGVVVARL
jgi:hypothetical protein